MQKPEKNVARYQLVIEQYPDESLVSKVCELIYLTSKDRNLLASLSTLPYSVGRTFSTDEARPLHEALGAANPATVVSSGHTHRHRRHFHGSVTARPFRTDS